jgi:UDP-sugar transporter A1/2/3
MVSISGFSSVYLEGMMKGREGSYEPTIWERNFQLSSYSILFLVLLTTSQNYYNAISNEEATSNSNNSLNEQSNNYYVPFKGWSLLTVFISCLSASGGILVASTLKYADSVSKCFASAVSIIITTLVGYFALNAKLNFSAILGMCTTVISVLNYALDATPPQPQNVNKSVTINNSMKTPDSNED